MPGEIVDLYYGDYGSGIPLVLLHGFPFNNSIWMQTVRDLEDVARLISPDLRGHGKSPAPGGVYSMSLMADDVNRVLENLEIDKAIIVGHSMGGYISLSFAEKYPHKLLGLGLVASHDKPDSSAKQSTRYEMVKKVADLGPRVLSNDMPAGLSKDTNIQERICKMIENTSINGIVGSLKGMAIRPGYESVLSKLAVSVLIVVGEEDQIVDPKMGREMVGKTKRGDLVVIPGVGHMPMLEAPHVLKEGLIQLIRLCDYEHRKD